MLLCFAFLLIFKCFTYLCQKRKINWGWAFLILRGAWLEWFSQQWRWIAFYSALLPNVHLVTLTHTHQPFVEVADLSSLKPYLLLLPWVCVIDLMAFLCSQQCSAFQMLILRMQRAETNEAALSTCCSREEKAFSFNLLHDIYNYFP